MMLHRPKTASLIIIAGLILLLSFCSNQSTKPPADTTPPMVMQLFPTKDSTSVATDTQIFIVFPKPFKLIP
jgi:hypothetical protein